MERLDAAVQDLSHARDLDAVTAIVRDAARNLTGADGATFVLQDGDMCYYAEENAIAPLWKGRRFPMSTCVSGWVMINAQSAVIEDIYADPRVPVEVYRPTFVKSMAMVPIRRTSPIGAIGNYWSSRRAPTAEELAILQALADTTSVALENAELYTRLQGMVHRLQEQQRRISEQHASLGVFTRALAHDLREPVRTLMSFSDLLRETPEDEPASSDRQATYFRFIGESAARMGMVIDSVSQYTRLDVQDEPERLTCNLADIVEDVRQNLARIIAERGTVLIHAALPDLVADAVQLRQLLQNLIANAILHNEGPVTVTIAHDIVEGRDRFSVSDNGVGIRPSEIDQVFQPFRRLVRSNESSRLGLAICRRIVALYGGKICCSATRGNGATFLFTLPDAAFHTPCDLEGRSESIATVLIVDDREADLELIELALFKRPGYFATCAAPATDARSIACSLQGTDIDLILLDINMPDVDAFRLLEQIREDERLRDMLVIMCSGSDYRPAQRRSVELGAAGYLLKPPHFSSFRDIVAGQPGPRLIEDESGLTLFRACAEFFAYNRKKGARGETAAVPG
ncbi:ATP-binding protein [Novosphingobium sp.]|uniref:ATP-binding protein n=1 Tax=Novosphingobium sp. TaxID=1874826 RepID=UPI003D6CDDA4